MPAVSIDFEGTEPARLKAIKESAEALVAKFDDKESDECVWNVAESVWPALAMPEYRGKAVKNVHLRLVPLARIGQMEGKSGSLVLIGVLADADDAGRPHSHPVVVKTLSVAERDKLRQEYDNARSIKPFAYDQKDNLAIPISFETNRSGFDVLWSIYSPADPSWHAGKPGSTMVKLGIEDLRKPLEDGDDAKAKPIIDATFSLLRNLHRRLNQADVEERSYSDEYKRYLRGFDDGVWGDKWREAWGPQTVEKIYDAGKEFTNPFWVLEKLRDLRKPLFIGAVHGDLHPGNVVITGGHPRIIDFGWAQDRAHIMKDFALMECNLRFHTVRPELNQRDVYALSDWIEWDEPVPTTLGAYAKARAVMIQHLRSIAKDRVSEAEKTTDWQWEYIVPLFFVAFGLLRFATQLGNQQAAVRFVLSLASQISQKL
jgi:hypothetical protein